MKARNFLFMSLGVLALTIAATLALQQGEGPAFAAGRADRGGETPAGVSAPLSEQIQNELAAVAAAVNPTIVNIDVERPSQAPQGYQFWHFGPDMPLPPELREFFGLPNTPQGRQQPRRPEQRAAGSGVIIDAENGYIVTNNHVVEEATSIGVTTFDGTSYEAKVVGTDPRTDIAVVKIEPRGDLRAIVLGDSDKVEVGHMCMAFGQPEGLKYTVTQGIISAKGRGDLGIIRGPGGIAGYEDFIQTDAAVNPGNSGGALTDIHGRLIGINTAIATSGVPQFGGISFAVPVNIVKAIVPQLIEHGEVTRGWIGVSISNLSDQPQEVQDRYALGGKGVYVADVTPGQPAAKAGMRPEDVIVGFGGRPVDNTTSLRNAVAEAEIGSTQPVEVARIVDGKPQRVTLEVQIAKQPQNIASLLSEQAGGIGIQAQTLTPELAQALGYSPDTTGVVVTQVAPDSRAAKADIQAGDVIDQIRHNGQTQPIASVQDLRQVLSSVPDGKPFAVRRIRQGQVEFVPVK